MFLRCTHFLSFQTRYRAAIVDLGSASLQGRGVATSWIETIGKILRYMMQHHCRQDAAALPSSALTAMLLCERPGWGVQQDPLPGLPRLKSDTTISQACLQGGQSVGPWWRWGRGLPPRAVVATRNVWVQELGLKSSLQGTHEGVR